MYDINFFKVLKQISKKLNGNGLRVLDLLRVGLYIKCPKRL